MNAVHIEDTGLSDDELAHMHWIKLYFASFRDGFSEVFPDTEACRKSLAQARWPQGEYCLRCDHRDVGFLVGRKIYYCRACSYQFSVTTNTFLHRSRVDLWTWFHSAQIIINSYANRNVRFIRSGFNFQRPLRISYVASVRLKAALMTDLNQSDGGLLAKCLCDAEALAELRKVPNSPDIYSLLLKHR